MKWLDRAKAHFLQKAWDSTDKTDKTPLSSVSSVRPRRICEKTHGVSSVSSVGVVALFENCIPAEELLAAAMRACDTHGDGEAAREQMRQDVLDTPPELRQELLAHFNTHYPRSVP